MWDERQAAPNLYLGTSSWSSKDWVGTFYPVGTKPTDFIVHYAQTYRSVEIDSTFYGVPRQRTIEGWRDRTPEGFLFAAKAPKSITHDKFLESCDRELAHFVDSLSLLGSRLGPLLFQFPYYAKRTGVTPSDFLRRLEAFLPRLPKGEFRFAIEVRNKAWLKEPLFNLLGRYGVTLALIDHPWMAPPGELFGRKGVLTGDFAYIRWLGDRHGIEKQTTTWNEIIVDRSDELKQWSTPIKSLLDGQMDVFGYVNNHYAGYAPENVDQIARLLD